MGGKITRRWTKGHVDHAAMIIKLNKGQAGNSNLFMLESVMVRGVSFTSWEMFKGYNDIYDEVFYRKLNCVRDKTFYDNFDNYIEQVQGNDYELNIKNLIFKDRSKRMKSVNIDLENRNFFCSELIVKCYKEMGMLETERASTTFTPQDLSISAKDPFVLTKDYELLDDQLILFP